MQKDFSNEKRVSIKDIALKLGISKGAVSLALNDSKNISKATKRKVHALAEKLGYKRNEVLSTVMSSIKASDAKHSFETIVIINANKDKDVQKKYTVFAKYIEGAKKEAENLGYSICEIWLHDKLLTPEKLDTILKSRGVRGGVVLGHMNEGSLPEEYIPIWKKYKFVSAGLRTFNPMLDFISADKFLISHHITVKVIKDGFKRPAMVLDERVDDLVEGRFVGGFLRAQLRLPEKDRIPPFLTVNEARETPRILYDWIKKWNPDSIVSVSQVTTEWLESDEVSLPKNMKIIQLDRTSRGVESIDMDENYRMIGSIAVKKLSDMLNRPTYFKDINIPTATIVTPHWDEYPEGTKDSRDNSF